MLRIYSKAILPLGFQANAVASGIKKSGKLDLALFYSQLPAKAACLFTANKIQAACLKLCRQNLQKGGSFQALIANSGNANCFTGKQGMLAAEKTAQAACAALGIKKESVLVASTGIIAKQLPVEKIQQAMPELVTGLGKAGIDLAKKALITTDTFAKEISVKLKISGKEVVICGVAKGAGMIAPDMATMLAFIFTDADIAQKAMQQALKKAVDNSFNCITVDGCMSTNDLVVLMANAAAGNPQINGGKNLLLFSEALNVVCQNLAKMIVRDAEGGTKFIRIVVSGSQNHQQAKRIALSIANSNLFKTAMFASSANVLGRIVAAAGAAGVKIKEEYLSVSYGDLKQREIEIKVRVGKAKGSAVIYTSDLSYEYVKINAEYN